MPAENVGTLRAKFRSVLLFIIFSLLFIFLAYYLVLYYKVDNTQIRLDNKDADLYEKVYDASNNESVLKRQYPADTEFPSFVTRGYIRIPEEMEANYDLLEYIDMRVVSTGRLSTVTIKNSSGTRDFAEILQLEVYIDDTEGFLKDNEHFNIALRVYPITGLEGDEKFDIAPFYLKNIFQGIERKKQLSELRPDGGSESLTEEEINLLNDNTKEVGENHPFEAIEQKDVEELFKEGTVWELSPYLKDDLVKYTLGKKDALFHDFIVLANEYYDGSDSQLIEKILSKSMSNIKNPVMVSDLYMNSE